VRRDDRPQTFFCRPPVQEAALPFEGQNQPESVFTSDHVFTVAAVTYAQLYIRQKKCWQLRRQH
jgi:hypothetical protein